MDLAAVQTPLEGWEILTTALLFVLPKEGHEGEWQVIADMLLQGGHNECIAGDPVFLPRISHILDQIYTLEGTPWWLMRPSTFINFPLTQTTAPTWGYGTPYPVFSWNMSGYKWGDRTVRLLLADMACRLFGCLRDASDWN